MKIYTLKRTQFLPVTPDEGWAFLSSPRHLVKITPKEMGFKIQYLSGEEEPMYAGQIIRYKNQVLPLVSIQWVPELHTHTHRIILSTTLV
jgi:ligand-binding SRPBCC domain-containing protein